MRKGSCQIVTHLLAAEPAKDLTGRIRSAAENVWELLILAYQGRVWVALGYTDWDTYCAKELGDLKIRLPREVRREAVIALRDSGMSLRAIAAATGYDKHTVSRDLASGANAPVEAQLGETPAIPVNAQTHPHTIGTNGKTYPRPNPGIAFWKFATDLAMMGDRMAKAAGQQGFAIQQERVKEASLRDLRRAREAIDQVIAKLEGALA